MRDPAVSPLFEIFSEWGNAEHDRGPYPYIRHSHGGRWTLILCSICWPRDTGWA
jgi:hypothetical protein